MKKETKDLYVRVSDWLFNSLDTPSLSWFGLVFLFSLAFSFAFFRDGIYWDFLEFLGTNFVFALLLLFPFSYRVFRFLCVMFFLAFVSFFIMFFQACSLFFDYFFWLPLVKGGI